MPCSRNIGYVMHAIVCQGNGKYYVSAVFGYYRDITATDDYKRYLEGIHKPYWIVWDSEKKPKAFNQQVRNNIEKFDEDFRFQITREELDELVRSKILTSREETQIIKRSFIFKFIQSDRSFFAQSIFNDGETYMYSKEDKEIPLPNL